MTLRLEVLPETAWADHVADELAARLAEQLDLVVCLPTGGTPLPVYERLPAALTKGGASAGASTVVLLDEYLGLPPGHAARCDTLLEETLLRRLEPRPSRVIPFDVDVSDWERIGEAFDAAVAAAGGLDLVVLGLGANGHVGMNEPGSLADAPTRVVDLTPRTSEAARERGADPPPTYGVTLGMAPILAAPEVWLLATGVHKASILATALEGPVGPDVPASLLRRHPLLRVLVDEPAAFQLTRSESRTISVEAAAR